MREASFQFLCLQGGGSDLRPVQARVQHRHMREKLANALSSSPAVLVVRNDDLPAILNALGERAIDRGTKHPAVPLARLVVGQKGISVIRGLYTSGGQMLRSLRTLLLHTLRRGESHGCVIGVAESVFEQMWQRSRVSAGMGQPTESDDLPGAPGSSANLLKMLLQDAEPADLAERLAGTSPHIRLVRQLILRAAKTRQTVLLLGDMGTGKNVVAHAIHDLARGPGGFVNANCIILAASRFNATLFGESLRSGTRGRPISLPGLWEKAGEGGTLYLDEISALNLTQQAELNEALRTGEYLPPGGRTMALPDAQVVVSSARDVGSLVRSGQFLADLFYRLHEFTIHTPTLRERPEDIPILAQALWLELAGEKARPLSEQVLASLQSYAWPGNVRELKSILSSLHTLFGDGQLSSKQVETLMVGQGYATPSAVLGARAQGQDGESVRCVRHLLRTEEIVQSLQQTLCLPATNRRSKGQTLDRPAVEAVGRSMAELELLFFTPALFGTIETYTLINALKGKVHYFHSLLMSDKDKALHFLEDDLVDALKTTPARIRSSINGLLAGIG